MRLILLFCLILLWAACSDNEQATNSNAYANFSILDSYLESDEMVLLSGDSVILGSNDKSFKAYEKPAMKVLISYDFFIGKHEVTCIEYADIAKKAKLKTFGKCKNDSTPITDITYYDAVLFANALSKLNEHDTAYTYSKAVFDKEGHCTFLEGFAFNPNTDSYRLPTETEWVYAATKDWNIKKSWNSSNSDYTSHKVCTKGTDATGLCDMTGNVMEWVNDWLGNFRDTTVKNYVGAPDGNDKGERIIKGGYYALSAKEINPYSRGDVYTVTSSTKEEFVGFRLAFGHIPEACWMNDDGLISSSVVTPLASSETIKSTVGTYNVKLVFRNDVSGNLAYLNYKNGAKSVKEITSGINAYHPEISPDGNWVAYSTTYEGSTKNSSLYVQNLNDNSAKPILLKNESATIPRWRVLDNGDTIIIYVSSAKNNQENSIFKATSTWKVPFAKGKFGTPQKLFDGAYHGGISEDNTLAVTGARLLRARIAPKGASITEKAIDTVWFDGQQACNVSLAQDKSKRTAFLDFDGKIAKKFVNEKYSTHQRILIADSTGKLIQTIKSPSGYTFDHSEWVKGEKESYLIATLTNANGAHTKIVLVNPADSSITELAESDELWHPNLWIEHKTKTDTNITFAPDSAGMYYNSSGAANFASRFRYKMEFLWQYKDSANVAILGSSRSYYGVNPLLFDKSILAVNFAVPATIISGNSFLFHHYILPHLSKLKVVIFSIDLDRGYDPGDDSDNIFHESYKSYPGYVYDKNHNYWINQKTEALFKATFDSPGVESYAKILRPTRGYDEAAANGWGFPKIKEDSVWTNEQKKSYQNNLDKFKEVIKACEKKDIYVIGVLFPQNPKYKNTGAYGANGLQRSVAPSLIKELSSLSKDYPNFILMDENKMGNHDYSDDDARDYSHLSKAGAEKITHRLDSLIKTLNIDFAR